MNDSDQIQDLPSDPPSQKKYLENQLHIQSLLKSSPKQLPSREIRPKQQLPSIRADEVRSPQAKNSSNDKKYSRTEGLNNPQNLGKQLLALSTHSVVGAFLLLLILLIAPPLLPKLKWVKPASKPFFIVGVWFLCEFFVNLIFLVVKKK